MVKQFPQRLQDPSKPQIRMNFPYKKTGLLSGHKTIFKLYSVVFHKIMYRSQHQKLASNSVINIHVTQDCQNGCKKIPSSLHELPTCT